MHDDRSSAAHRVRALTGLPTVLEATGEGRDAEVLWMLCRRADEFRRAGRARDALSEATAAAAWALAVRAGDPAAPGEEPVPAPGGEILGLALEQARQVGDGELALGLWDEAREAVIRTIGCEVSPPAWDFMAIALRMITAQVA
jgi:hypothetical protein